MKKLAAAGYLTLFRDFKLARMIKTYRSASCHQVVKIREHYICYRDKYTEQQKKRIFCIFGIVYKMGFK